LLQESLFPHADSGLFVVRFEAHNGSEVQIEAQWRRLSRQPKSRRAVDPLSPTILFNNLQSVSGLPPTAM
jgi:hypothetical protein